MGDDEREKWEKAQSKEVGEGKDVCAPILAVNEVVEGLESNCMGNINVAWMRGFTRSVGWVPAFFVLCCMRGPGKRGGGASQLVVFFVWVVHVTALHTRTCFLRTQGW